MHFGGRPDFNWDYEGGSPAMLAMRRVCMSDRWVLKDA